MNRQMNPEKKKLGDTNGEPAKYVILGDIHGRSIWKAIIEKEKPEKVIFLGDYVTSRKTIFNPQISVAQQKRNFLEILQYKMSHPDDVVLLRGNHDIDMLDYPWARCRPSAYEFRKQFGHETALGKQFIDNSQWCYQIPEEINGEPYPFIASHAGISELWLKRVLRMETFDAEAINALPIDDRFWLTPYFSTYGEQLTDSLLWIRPSILEKYPIPGYSQIIGHTYRDAIPHQEQAEYGDEFFWLCDSLEF